MCLPSIAEGTARDVARRTTLLDYPQILSTGSEHVEALSDALAQFGRTARIGIEEMNELEDAASADILTEICHGVDKWLWFVEAHVQDGARRRARVEWPGRAASPLTSVDTAR